MKELAPTVPLIMLTEELQVGEQRITTSSTRKVSFAESEGFIGLQQHHFGSNDDPLASFRTTAIASETFNEEQRVISNETIDSLPKMKNKSRSLPSLSRSGDLKSLLLESSRAENSNFNHNHHQIQIPSVSEDCLLSTSCLHENHNIINSSICESHSDHHPLGPIIQNVQQPSCSSGWGQFVDFMPLDQSPKKKNISPRSRRRNASSSSSSSCRRFRRYSEGDMSMKKYSSINRKTRKSRLATASLYNRKKDIINSHNHQHNKNKSNTTTTSTNEIVSAFQVQLTL